MVLQATNDITINSVIAANADADALGNLTLQARRSVLLNAPIDLASAAGGGDVTVIANESLASGVVNNERASGEAVITMAPGAFITTPGGGRAANFG